MLWSLLACRFHDSDFSLTQELISQQAKMDPTSTRKAPSLSSYAPLLSSLCFSGDVEGWERDFEAGGLVQKLQKRELIATHPIFSQPAKLSDFVSRSWLGWEGLTGEHMFVLPFSAFQQINHRRHLPHPVLSHPCSCSWILRAGETSAFLSLLSRRWVGGEGEQELGSSSCHSPSGGKQTIACVVPLQ